MQLFPISTVSTMSVTQLLSSESLASQFSHYGLKQNIIVTYRLARNRDEWESAMLQNANTKCNGLMPLWGPEVHTYTFDKN